MNPRRVLLVHPAEETPEWPTFPRAVEPMGLLYVAGAFQEAGVEVEILDQELGYGDLHSAMESVARGRFGGAGLALASQTALAGARKIARELKALRPELPVFCGGVFASLNADWILSEEPAIDFVVVGEAEPFAFAISAPDGDRAALPRVRRRGAPALPAGIPAEPLSAPGVAPDRRLAPLVIARGEAPSIVGSRGCLAACSFCAISEYYGSNWRAREVASVVEEIRDLGSRLGVSRFHLVDDSLFERSRPGRVWSRSLVEALAALDGRFTFKTTCPIHAIDEDLVPLLARAGFRLLKIGIETFSRETQRVYRKVIGREMAERRLRTLLEAGIELSLGFIMFDPWSRVADLRENLEFLLAFRGSFGRHLLLSRLAAYRGTAIERKLVEDGLVESRDIRGARWRFRDPEVGGIHDRYESWLRSHVLEIERRLHRAQKASLDAGLPARGAPELAHELEECWILLFQEALTGRREPSVPLAGRLARLGRGAVG